MSDEPERTSASVEPPELPPAPPPQPDPQLITYIERPDVASKPTPTEGDG